MPARVHRGRARPHDPELAARISRYVRRMEEAFEEALARARGAGEIPVAAGGDPKALARFLVSTLHVQAADDRRRSGADAAG